jgi:hypothetical protein
VDEYEGGRSLEELQNYIEQQLAMKNVNADRTDEKIPDVIQDEVPEEKPEENLVQPKLIYVLFIITICNSYNKFAMPNELWGGVLESSCLSGRL